jgi:hypothetical protein
VPAAQHKGPGPAEQVRSVLLCAIWEMRTTIQSERDLPTRIHGQKYPYIAIISQNIAAYRGYHGSNVLPIERKTDHILQTIPLVLGNFP